MDTKGPESEARTVNTVGKTPVCLLQEICALDSIVPNYSLVQTEGVVHEPHFKYRVDVKSVTATGSGQSKKKAKHVAAKIMLSKLQSLVNKGKETQFGVLSTLDLSEQIELAAQLDEAAAANYVGDLMQLCTTHRLKPPLYEATLKPDCDRKFVVTCTVGSTVTTGEGTSKKSAKREASRLMLQSLSESLSVEDANHCDDDLSLTESEILHLGRPRVGPKKRDMERPNDENFLDWYPVNSYKGMHSALHERAIVVESRPIVIFNGNDVDSEACGEAQVNAKVSTVRDATFEDEIRLMIEKELTSDSSGCSNKREAVINYDSINSILFDDRGKDGRYMAVVQMAVSPNTSIPSLVGHGLGQTGEEAQLEAANRLIDIIRQLRES